MDYHETIDYLFNLQKYGIKLGLLNITQMLEALQNPHKHFQTVHVAGTNGKGSTAAMVASILQAHGFSVGLFVSPHMVRFTERISINNVEIPQEEVVRLTNVIRDSIHQIPDLTPTFFEFVTAMAFVYFKEKGIDWAIIETGMGGRFDSTNVISPEVSIITHISEDHKQFLGDTIEKIAYEKAGIIKPYIAVVCSYQESEVLEVLSNKATETSSTLALYGQDFKALNIGNMIFDYYGINKIQNIKLSLAGKHQIENASCAIRAFECLNINIDVDLIKKALLNLKWAGRCESIHHKGKHYILDGGHNYQALYRLREFLLEDNALKKIILIYGAMSDKDNRKMLNIIAPIARKIIFTAPSYGRAENPAILKDLANLPVDTKSYVTNNVKEAMCLLDKIYESGELIVVTGSFYTVGEVKELFGEPTLLKSLTEFK